MTEIIGVAAVSAPGAALCFETLCTEAQSLLGEHAHPEIAMHAFSFAEHVAAMERGDWPAVARLLGDSARKLASLGAAFAVCPDNTAHRALDDVDSPIPWLHIADAVTAEAERIGTGRVAILGTRWLMEARFYPERFAAAGIESAVPEPPDRDLVHGVIFDELVHGRVPQAARRELAGVIERLRRERDCDAVLLGCTELPLAVGPDETDLPLLDSTRLLARAAIRRACGAPGATPPAGPW